MHGYSGMGEGWVLYSYPIHMAVSHDNVSFLRLLLKHGADPLKEYSDFNLTQSIILYLVSVNCLQTYCYIMFFLGFLEIVPKRTKDSWFSFITVYLNRYVQVHNLLNSSLPFAQRNSRD